MLYLKSNHDNSHFYLLTGKTHFINRKDGDLILGNDQSISRNHSAALVSNEGEVFLWDEGSKYGTFIYEGTKERKLEKEERYKLKIGDQMRFGLQWNIFKLCKTDIVVCTSSINNEEKRTLKNILSKIGGKFRNDWSDQCTHLTMNRVSLTHKVVFALAAGKPIVTMEYWQKMEEAVTNHLELPKFQDYLPSIGEEELQKQTKPDTLLPSKNRKMLFKGKIFIFSSEDRKNKLESLVKCADGLCKSVQTSKVTPEECCESNYVVLRESDECATIMRNIICVLKQKGLRSIPVSEIGLAIYNDSLVRYCNPSYCKPVILGGSPSQSQGVCLVENTEDIQSSQPTKVDRREDIVIPPSLTSIASDSLLDSSRSAKRPSSPTSVDSRPPKRRNQESQKGGGSLRNWLISESDKKTSANESEATCSFTASRDMSSSNSPKTRNDKTVPKNSRVDNGPSEMPPPKKNTGKRGRTEDEDSFEVPHPERATRTKRGRTEDDPIKFPIPKKTAATKTKANPVVERADPFQSDDTIEDNSDDEFEISKYSRNKTRRVSSPAIEDNSDDEFELRASDKKTNRRIADDETSNKTNETASGGKNTSNKSKNVQESGPSTSRHLEEPRKIGPPQNRGSSRAEARNGSTRANMSDTRKIVRQHPNLSEFMDKSAAAAVKKEESEEGNEEGAQQLSDILDNIKIIETSMYRQRPPLRVQISSISLVDGRPNFKKFKKSTQQTERRRIDLIVDHNISMYVGIPEPDPDVPENDSARDDSENNRVEDLFPSTNERIQRNLQNRQTRQESRIVDEWTVS